MKARRPRPASYQKYLGGQTDDRYLDPSEMRGIEMLAKQFKIRMLGRQQHGEVVGEIRSAVVDKAT